MIKNLLLPNFLMINSLFWHYKYLSWVSLCSLWVRILSANLASSKVFYELSRFTLEICSSRRSFYFLYLYYCCLSRLATFSYAWIFMLSTNLSYYSLWYFKSEVRVSTCSCICCYWRSDRLRAFLSFDSSWVILSQLLLYFYLRVSSSSFRSIKVLFVWPLSWDETGS